jgi:hypothetical protein
MIGTIQLNHQIHIENKLSEKKKSEHFIKIPTSKKRNGHWITLWITSTFLKKKDMTFVDTIESFINHFDNSSNLIVKLQLNRRKFNDEFRHFYFAWDEKENIMKLMLEVGVMSFDGEIKCRIQKDFVERPPPKMVVIQRKPIIISRNKRARPKKEVLQVEQGTPPVKKEEMKTEPENPKTEVKVIQEMGNNPIRSNMEVSFEDMMQEAVPVEMFNFFQVKKKEEPKKDTQSVIIIEREPLIKYQWEIDQYNEDKRREKEDAEEEKRKKRGSDARPRRKRRFLTKNFWISSVKLNMLHGKKCEKPAANSRKDSQETSKKANWWKYLM